MLQVYRRFVISSEFFNPLNEVCLACRTSQVVSRRIFFKKTSKEKKEEEKLKKKQERRELYVRLS
jgi:hypothetical protein